MIYLKGDIVKTKSGETGEIVDTWGIARDWCKIKTDNNTIYIMATDIDSLVSRPGNKKRTWWR